MKSDNLLITLNVIHWPSIDNLSNLPLSSSLIYSFDLTMFIFKSL